MTNEETVSGNKNEFLKILKHYKDSVAKFNSSQLREASVYDAMLVAAKHGNVEFIKAMWEANHDLLWAMDNHGRDIFVCCSSSQTECVPTHVYSLWK